MQPLPGAPGRKIQHLRTTNKIKKSFHLDDCGSCFDDHPLDEDRLREYIEEEAKDRQKHQDLKQRIKTKFFQVNSCPEGIIKKPPSLSFSSIPKVSPQQKQPIFLSASANLSNNKKQVNNELVKILQRSAKTTMSAPNKSRYSRKGQSERQDKINKQIMYERGLIIKFNKYNSERGSRTKKWSNLSNIQKYTMDFSDYVRKKSKSSVQKEVYLRKVYKRRNQMQKFQDFILRQVQFGNENKQKLQMIFHQIQKQFRRAEGSHSVIRLDDS